MKVRVAYTIEVTAERRTEINAHYGKTGMATREEVVAWYREHGEAMDLDLDWHSDAPNRM